MKSAPKIDTLQYRYVFRFKKLQTTLIHQQWNRKPNHFRVCVAIFSVFIWHLEKKTFCYLRFVFRMHYSIVANLLFICCCSWTKPLLSWELKKINQVAFLTQNLKFRTRTCFTELPLLCLCLLLWALTISIFIQYCANTSCAPFTFNASFLSVSEWNNLNDMLDDMLSAEWLKESQKLAYTNQWNVFAKPSSSDMRKLLVRLVMFCVANDAHSDKFGILCFAWEELLSSPKNVIKYGLLRRNVAQHCQSFKFYTLSNIFTTSNHRKFIHPFKQIIAHEEVYTCLFLVSQLPTNWWTPIQGYFTVFTLFFRPSISNFLSFVLQVFRLSTNCN